MQNTIDLFNQLKKAGVAPKLIINLSPNTADITRVKQLQADFEKAGIASEVHIDFSLDVSDQGSSSPVIPVDNQPTGPVIVSVPKANCRVFRKMDKVGKPIMEIREPRVQLFQGDRFSISMTHKAGDKDPGDGTVIATGGIKHYLIVDCPPNRDADGLYVRESDVTLL